MKVKWVELTEDDPIFNQGFIISYPIKKRPYKNQPNITPHSNTQLTIPTTWNSNISRTTTYH